MAVQAVPAACRCDPRLSTRSVPNAGMGADDAGLRSLIWARADSPYPRRRRRGLRRKGQAAHRSEFPPSQPSLGLTLTTSLRSPSHPFKTLAMCFLKDFYYL
jgi:hypothetical protein